MFDNIELAVIQNLFWESFLFKKIKQGRQINSLYFLVSLFFLWKWYYACKALKLSRMLWESLPPWALWVGVEVCLLLGILAELKAWAASPRCTDAFWGMLGSTALCACASVKIIGASGVGHPQNKDRDDRVLAVGCLRGDWTLSALEELHNSWSKW